MASLHSQCSGFDVRQTGPLSVVSIRTHRGSGERLVTLNDLKNVAHLSQEKAAAALNVGNTRFKSACRELGMKGWPYRKIKSVRNLQLTVEENLGQHAAADILAALENLVELHFHNPTLPLDDTFKIMRQAAYKKKHGQKRARATEGLWSERRGCSCSTRPVKRLAGTTLSPALSLDAEAFPKTPQDRAEGRTSWSGGTESGRDGDGGNEVDDKVACCMSPRRLSLLRSPTLTPLALPLGLSALPIPEVSPGLFCRLLEHDPEPLTDLLEDCCESC